MKNIILSIFLLIISCGEIEMGKPAQNLGWIATGNKTDPLNMGVNGFVTQIADSKINNWMFANITEWQEFTDRAFGKEYYVACNTGDDNNDGSVDNPFLTLKKVVDSVENGGYGRIILKEAGDYLVEEDINLINKSIVIETLLNVTQANIKFVSYLDDSNQNNLYGFNLYQNSSIFATVYNVIIDAPFNTGKTWNSDSSGIRFFDGLAKSGIFARNQIQFSNTSASGAAKPSLFMNWYWDYSVRLGIPAISIGTTAGIVTNSKGYVVDSNGGLVMLQKTIGVIDDPDYWVDGIVNQNQILYTGLAGMKIGSFKIRFATDGTTTYETPSIDADASDNTIKTHVETLLDSAFRGGYDVNVNVSTVRYDPGTDEDLVSISLEMVGDLSGKNMPITMYWDGSVNGGIFYETQRGKTGLNILTNIKGLTN